MKRRDFILLLGGAATMRIAWPLVAWGQQDRIYRIGYLSLASPPPNEYDDAFRAGLHDLGYVEGKTLDIEFRFSEGQEDRLPGLAAELIALNVDVIVSYATGVPAAHRVTATIPIVMANGGDPVASGIAASLAHPGGNVTGMTFFYPKLMAKRLEVLKQVAPSTTRAGVLLVRGGSTKSVLEVMGATAKTLTIELRPIEIGAASDFESAFAAFADMQIGGFVMSDHALFGFNAAMIAGLAAKHRLPSIGQLELPASGGLIGYGVNFFDQFRRAAFFVDKILNGVKPGDIPIEQAAKFETIVNLKAAKALGLDVPPSLLAAADEVIE